MFYVASSRKKLLMNDISCILISKCLRLDENGNVVRINGKEIIDIQKTEIPIIRIEDIFKKEFYTANERGLKPSLRIVINSLNYSDEDELEYMDKEYSIIRAEGVGDEKTLICERKIGNAKQQQNKY